MEQDTPHESTTTKTVSLPLMCNSGHQIYIVYFPPLDQFGFACAMCHSLGTSITHGEKVLQVMDAVESRVRKIGLQKDDLLFGVDVRAVHQKCPKGHNLMAFEFTQGFGVGCIHCKIYSLTFGDKGRTYEIRVTRELDPMDPKVKLLPRRAALEEPAFTLN